MNLKIVENFESFDGFYKWYIHLYFKHSKINITVNINTVDKMDTDSFYINVQGYFVDQSKEVTIENKIQKKI